MPSFSELNKRQQTSLLGQVALDAAKLYGLDGIKPALVYHGYNTTFRFDHPRERYAMRINVNSRRTPEQIAGEVAWIEALSKETNLTLPIPVRFLKGEPTVRIANSYFPEQLSIVLYHWLDGRHMSEKLGTANAEQIGGIMRVLHNHGEHFVFPRGTSRPQLMDVFDSLPWRLSDAPLWTDARDEAQAVMDKLEANPRQVVHFDVHLRNLKKIGDRIAVFDFDDSVIAWPVMDIAQSMFYLRRALNAEAIESSLWKGIGQQVEDYGVTRKEFEALVAGRALLLACDLVGNNNAELQALTPMYLARTEYRLQEYRRTGRFDSSLTPSVE